MVCFPMQFAKAVAAVSEMAMPPGWIQTRVGARFWPTINRGAIALEDIAHHLALRNRFSGATARPYSVAQHSLIVSAVLPDELKLQGLLHDAAEAYLPDIPRPIKDDFFIFDGSHMRSFSEVEDDIMQRVGQCYGFSWPMPEEVKQADLRVCATERRDLMGSDHRWDVVDDLEPYEIGPIKPLKWKKARRLFLETFERLTG